MSIHLENMLNTIQQLRTVYGTRKYLCGFSTDLLSLLSFGFPGVSFGFTKDLVFYLPTSRRCVFSENNLLGLLGLNERDPLGFVIESLFGTGHVGYSSLGIPQTNTLYWSSGWKIRSFTETRFQFENLDDEDHPYLIFDTAQGWAMGDKQDWRLFEVLGRNPMLADWPERARLSHFQSSTIIHSWHDATHLCNSRILTWDPVGGGLELSGRDLRGGVSYHRNADFSRVAYLNNNPDRW